jgi:predicted ribosome quality control (RQC) complex YloA/Tae2 family protein
MALELTLSFSSIDPWIDRVSLIPDKLNQRLVKSYRGLSPILMNEPIATAGLDPVQTTNTLSRSDREKLFEYWQKWLSTLAQVEGDRFHPHLTDRSFSILGWSDTGTPVATVNQAIETYYTRILDREAFTQLKHQLTQQLSTILAKLRLKANTFRTKLEESIGADEYRTNADRSTKAELAETKPRSLKTPSGFELPIGRNNRQNDLLTFKTATEYDLWFHAQEIAGSHGLLRITPGAVAEEADLQFTANAVAYYSRARQSQAVPVVYTQTKHVYKQKGAKPGMVIYKHEQIVWGHPQTLGTDVKSH